MSSENEVTSPESIIFVGRNTASPLIVWADKSFKTLKVNIIGSKQVTSLNIENSSGENIQKVDIRAPECLNCLPHFLVHYETDSTSWAEVYHVDLKSSTISKAYQVPRVSEKSVFATSSKGANVFFTRITNSGISVFSSASHAILGRWDPKLGTVDHAISAVAEVATKGDSAAVRFAYTVDSGDWKLVRNGEVEWIRPESLAGVIAASWADVDLGIDLAHELEIEGHESLLGAYIHRVKRHAKDLQHLPDWLRALPKRIFTSFLTAEVSDLSSFGLAKLAIVATAQGRLIALDTGRNGAVAWNIPASESPHWKVKAITTDLGLATVHVDDGSTVSVNITTGDIVARTTPTAKIGSIVILENGSKLNIGEDGSPLGALTESTHLVTLSPDGRVLGWSAKSSAAPAWQFLPAKGERIIHATSRPAHDPVASIGKVLGDRSVLYKYLNPNLALITAVGETSVTFYLLDGVSGDVLHSVSHAGVDTTQPISSVISENWFAYSIWADATDESEPKGYQLVVSELYESPLPNDRGPLGAASNYSSLQGLNGSPPPRPHVISQSYLIAEPISHMSVTQTAQGITVRQLICVLPESNAIIGIPRMILDPRRPVGRDPTREEAEEGLVKYAPYLDFDGRWYLTHARDVLDIRTTISTPTLLESTSLIFAFGGDVFGTRVTPSQAFDLLGRGFSKLQLVATVVALTAGVAALAPMVSFLTSLFTHLFFRVGNKKLLTNLVFPIGPKQAGQFTVEEIEIDLGYLVFGLVRFFVCIVY